MSKKKKKKDIEPSQEDYENLLIAIEQFDIKNFIYLAETDRFEIIPTSTETGKVLTSDEISHLQREVEKLGYSILYKIDKENGETILVNARSLKTMVLVDAVQ